jgi:hypothetical protein
MKHIFLVFLFIFSLHLSTGAATHQDQKLSGEQIIQKHLDAVGGREALAKLKSRIAIGTVRKEDEPDSQMVIMSEAPNRVSAFYALRDYDLFMIYDGSKAIIRPVMPKNVSTITDKYVEILGSGLMFNSISLYSLMTAGEITGLSPEAKGMKKVGGRQAYVVQVKTPKGPMRLYFDAENFMWVRTDYGKASVSAGLRETGGNRAVLNQMKNEGGSETTVDFYIETSDFRDVDGVKLPFKFVQVLTSPILRKSAVGTITGTIREYRHNEPIDPKMFQ